MQIVSHQSPVTSHQKKNEDCRLKTEDFSTALAALGPFEPQPHFAIALSGGCDSMALALLADSYARAHGGHTTTLTVDHGLRTESKHEAEQVGSWMHSVNIPHVILTPAHTHEGNNLMNAARQWRYDALSDWCRSHHVLHCLIAHHAADQRETIAIHTARGETEDGSSGMRRARNYRGVRFLRPLLSCEKETLQEFLRSKDMPWVEDPTNTDEQFARARLRQQELADSRPTDRATREMEVAHAAALCVVIHADGFASVDRAMWQSLPPSIATQLLADIIRTIGGEISRPRKHKTLLLAEALRHNADTKRTLGGCLVRTFVNTIRIEPEKQSVGRRFAPAKPLAASPFW